MGGHRLVFYLYVSTIWEIYCLISFCTIVYLALNFLYYIISYHSCIFVKGFYNSNLSILRGDDPLKMAKNQPCKQPAEESQSKQSQDSGIQSNNPSRTLEDLNAELH